MTSVVVIVGIFFIIGITVGAITVIAMSALRPDRRDRPDEWPGHGSDGPDDQPPDVGWHGTASDEQPWWQSRDGD